MSKAKSITVRLVKTDSGDYRIGYSWLPKTHRLTFKDNAVIKVEPINGVC